jgi:hypothetical protein
VTPAAIPILEKQGMVSRALSFATVTLLVGCFAAGSAHAQATNLEAGKTPSQIFAGTCNVCHKSPRGLLKTVPASSLPGFLRQHYTTSSDMAGVLASFLVSNGATDTRYQGKDAPKQDPGKLKPDGKQEANTKPDAKPEQLDRFGRKMHPSAQEAAKPDADGRIPSAEGEGGRPGRDAKRQARQSPEGAKPEDGQTPAQAATDGKSGGKRLGRRGRPGEEPKADEAKGNAKDDAGKTESAKTDAGKVEEKPEAAKEAAKPAVESKPETPKSETSKSDTAKVDAPKDSGGEAKPLRPDPVPAVTPAPAPSATTASGTPEPAANPSAPAAASTPAPSAVTASAPPPPAAPAGPPTPPISQ